MSAQEATDSSPFHLASEQKIYCHTCCVLAKKAGKKENLGVGLAVTWEIQLYQNMPVAIPICGMHLYVGESLLRAVE